MPRLNIDVAMRLAEFQDGIKSIENQFGKLGRNLRRTFGDVRTIIAGALAVAGARGVVSQFSEINDQLGKIGDSAEQIGTTSTALQGLAYAASQNGVSFDDLTGALLTLAKNMSDFRANTGKAREAFIALKLSVEKSPGVLKDTDQFLGELADKFASFGPSTDKTALAIKLFGEQGAKLIPFLNRGRDGIDDLKQAAADLGIIIDDKTIAASKRFKDNLETLEKVYQSLKINFLGPLIKDLADITDVFSKAATKALDFSEKLKLIFSGNVNLGKFKELRDEEEKLLAAIATSNEAFVSPDDALLTGNISATQARLLVVQKEIAELNKLYEARGKLQEQTSEAKVGTKPAPPIRNTKDAEDSSKALLALQKARGEAEIAEEQRILADRLEVRKRFFDQGEILESDYYATNLQLQLDASKKTLAVLDQEVKARERAVAGTKAGTADRFNAEKDLLGAVEKRNEAEAAVAKTVRNAYFEQTDAAKAYGEEVKRITANLLELQGNTVAATALTTELAQADLRRRASQREDTGTIDLLNKQRDKILAEAAFNKERERGQSILDSLAVEEERIQNSRRVGAISDFEALTKTGEARKNTVIQLQAISDQLKGIADESGLPTLTKQAAAFQVQLESLATETDLLGDKFDSILQTGLGDLFSDLIDGSKSAKEAIQDFGKSVTKQINDLIAQNLSQKLFQSVLGGSGTSGGGFLSNLFSTGSLFGGGASATAGISAADLGIAFGGVFAQGGGFTVPGAGGQDSQLVAFKATPGEKVSVSTPQQSGGGAVINIHLNNPNFATGESIGQAGTRLGTAINRQLARNS